MIWPRPKLGEVELLVYGECDCGWRLAMPPGAHWPHCPRCNVQVRPPHWSGPELALRMGYVAELMTEQGAHEAICERRRS